MGAQTAQNPRLSVVLRETVRALHRVGYERVSVETLARRAGVSRSTIYRHWSNKRELVVAAVADLLSRRAPVIDSGEPDAVQALRRLVRDLVDLAGGDQATQSVSDFLRVTVRDPELGRLWQRDVLTPRRNQLVVLLRQGIRDGDLRKEFDAEVAADALVGAVHYRILVAGQKVTPAFGDRLVETVVAGFDHVEEHWGSKRAGTDDEDGPDDESLDTPPASRSVEASEPADDRQPQPTA